MEKVFYILDYFVTSRIPKVTIIDLVISLQGREYSYIDVNQL